MAKYGKSPKPVSRSSKPLDRLTFKDGQFTTNVRPVRRSRVLIFGPPGQGKSTFVTRYAPGPVMLINFDGRADDCVKEAQESGREIFYHKVRYPKNLISVNSDEAKRLGKEALEDTLHHYNIGIAEAERGNIRTISLDTGTELNDIISLSVTGTVDRVKDDYGRSSGLINQHWWSLIASATSVGVNLVILARDKEIWKGGKPSGNYDYRGSRVVTEAVDWSGHIRLNQKSKKKKYFELENIKSGPNIEEIGEVYTEEDWEDFGGPFAYANWMQYPDSEPEDWK